MSPLERARIAHSIRTTNERMALDLATRKRGASPNVRDRLKSIMAVEKQISMEREKEKLIREEIERRSAKSGSPARPLRSKMTSRLAKVDEKPVN